MITAKTFPRKRGRPNTPAAEDPVIYLHKLEGVGRLRALGESVVVVSWLAIPLWPPCFCYSSLRSSSRHMYGFFDTSRVLDELAPHTAQRQNGV
ncbi:unnamed protein product [Nezara viridula]|uniref:Uncharacterized protein n=1 Tax=Nezara viridula TaxID=85310 RepID=A0A9P0HIM7_NEZVI|nr:unnamed protein product [Nezara viridula]